MLVCMRRWNKKPSKCVFLNKAVTEEQGELVKKTDKCLKII